MFSRYTLVLGTLLLFVAIIDVSANPIVNGEPVQETQLNRIQNLKELNEVEARNPALVIAIRVLAKAFKWAAKHCLKEAAMNCKNDWKHPKALVKCGGSYLKRNKGRCVVG